MQGCAASATQTVLLTINGILKREKTICRIPRNTGGKKNHGFPQNSKWTKIRGKSHIWRVSCEGFIF